ncbi:MAG TPA: tRNA dihydrouridine(20/20a) synthase DusA [Cellvibrio sp.]|nr:tRNA dihydrouridine(20/20a) synthase DusA [Cellvibrio sp.]
MTSSSLDHRFTLAPMMEWSTSDCRTFWRLLTKQAVLYSEMVTTGALLHGDRSRFLDFNACEHPLALQLGGSNPRDLAECSKIAEDWGYDEVNLNCGCPSDRVQNGMIGACLMAEPELVADCIATMQKAVKIPVTVKHRIGIDDMEDYEGLFRFVSMIASTGCSTFIVHARKAWLKGLSPKENREVPPLQYDKVYQLKQDFPHLNIIINGGIKTLEQSKNLLRQVDGVMLGREAYSNPYLLAEVDQQIYGVDKQIITRSEVMQAFMKYCEEQLSKGARLNHLTRHVLGLYQGMPGARQFRRIISEQAHLPRAGIDVLERALQAVNEVTLANTVVEAV